jgi:hypothetical protein
MDTYCDAVAAQRNGTDPNCFISREPILDENDEPVLAEDGLPAFESEADPALYPFDPF